MAVTKRKRKPKVSKGIHGARKYPLTTIQKALMGKGVVQAFKPIGSVAPRG